MSRLVFAAHSRISTVRRSRMAAIRRTERQRLILEQLENRELLASDFLNPFVPLDVSDDGVVSPIDVLQIINDLNANGARELLTPTLPVEFFVDTNNDCNISAIDALLVINALNDDDEAPVPAVALQVDTGPGGTLNNDMITSDGRLAGTVTDLTGVSSLEVSVNGSAMSEVTVERDGSFTLDVATTDGLQSLSFVASDGVGNRSTSAFSFTLDTTPPAVPAQAMLDVASDSGASDSDGITNDDTPTFLADAETGSLVRLIVDGQEVASAEASSAVSLTSTALSDGAHRAHLIAEDVAGNVSQPTENIEVTIDTAAPTADDSPTGTLRRSFSSFVLDFDDRMAPAAFSPETFAITVNGGPNDGQDIEITSVDKFDDTTAVIRLADFLPDQDYQFTIDSSLLDLAGNQLAGDASFNFTMADPPGIDQLSPNDGAEMVNVTRETIVRFDEAVDPTTIDEDALFLIANGERVAGRIVPSSTEKFVTFFYDSALPPSTEVRVVVDGDRIMGRDGRALDADGDDEPGGRMEAEFSTLPLTRIAGTNVFGFVKDSLTQQPIVGATIRVDAFPDANAVTDDTGFFELIDMPAPAFFVHIDGTTATNAPVGFGYPNVGKPFHSVPGQRVQLNHHGDTFDVFLPPMADADVQTLSADDPVDVGFGDEGVDQLTDMFPEIDASVWEALEVTFEPGSAVDDQGNPATQAAIIPVPPDRLPAPLPPAADPALVISIQALGASNFDVPAPIAFPNLDNLPIGSHPTLWSFDHDLGEFRAIGTLEVVDDGNGGTKLVSDPGTGILAPGWHYTSPPLNWNGSGGKPKQVGGEVVPEIEVQLFTSGDTDQLSFRFEPPPGAGKTIGEHQLPSGTTEPSRVVDIRVRGTFKDFYKSSGDTEIRDQRITLNPGDAAVTKSAELKNLTEMLMEHNRGKRFENDRIYGATIDVTETLTLADGSVQSSRRIIAPYYLIDQSDDDQDDRIIKVADTVRTDDVSMKRKIVLKTGTAPAPFFVADGAAGADYSDAIDGFRFNPSAAGDRNARLQVEVTIEGQKVRSTGGPQLQGKGTEKQRVDINTAGLRAALGTIKVQDTIRQLITTGFGAQLAGRTYRLTFNGATTAPILYTAGAGAIQTALEGLGTIAAGDVDVRRTVNDVIGCGAGGVMCQLIIYEVDYKGNLEGTNFSISGSGTDRERTAGADGIPGNADDILFADMIPRNSVSRNEWLLVNTPAGVAGDNTATKRMNIANGVLTRIRDSNQLFKQFEDGIEVVDLGGPTAGADGMVGTADDVVPDNTISFLWDREHVRHTDRRGLLGTSRPTSTDNGVDNLRPIADLLKTNDFKNSNQPTMNYLFDQVVNISRKTKAEIYVDTPVEGGANVATAQQLINTLAKTAAHEAAHTLSARHTNSSRGHEISSDNPGAVMGRTDLLKQGSDLAGALLVQPTLTGPLLKVAGDLGYDEEEGKRAIATHTKNIAAAPPRGFDIEPFEIEGFEGTLTVGDELEEEAILESPLDGPVLLIVDEADAVVSAGIDLDAVEADGSGGALSEKTLTLLSIGSEAIDLSRVELIDANGVWSITDIAANTMLETGEEIELTISFDPDAPGEFAASLQIDSNDPETPMLEFDLEGLGLSVDPVFELAVGNSGNNNFGGVELGNSLTVTDMITVTNLGVQDLTFTPTLIDGAIDFATNGLGIAQTLASLESFVMPITFMPSTLGLLRGLLNFTTNDPTQTLVEQGVVGTGIPIGGIGSNDFHWGNDFVRVDEGPITHRMTSDDAGNFQVGLGTFSEYTVSIFDPVSELFASGSGFTGPSGAFNDITSTLSFRADTSPDTDFDGIPDDSERAIGTDINKKDTDTDKLSDLFELRQGLDPLGGLAFPTGIIASLTLPGTVRGMDVVDDSLYVATGSHGLAIVDGTEFDNPIVQGQLDLPGTARDVGVDARLGVAVVAAADQLHLVDVSDPMLPVLNDTLAISARDVIVNEGVAYVTGSSDLYVIDVLTGERIQQLPIGFNITDMAREGQHLYITRSGPLSVVDISTLGEAKVVGNLNVSVASADVGIFAGNDVVWIVGSGLNTVDVSDPTNPTLIENASPNFFNAKRIALNGSGIGILTPDFGSFVEGYDTSDPNDTAAKLFKFAIGGQAGTPAISRGLSYVGGGNRLEVLNYLPFDGDGEAPQVTISTPVDDVDPNTNGIQVFEGTTLPIRVDVTDDVQVRSVELLVNGEVTATDVAFPFDFTAVTPRNDSSTSIVVRANDTGGNTRLSNPLEIEVVPDTFPPTIVSVSPEDGTVRGSIFRTVRVGFSERMDEASLSAANIEVVPVGDGQVALVPVDIQIRDRGKSIQLTYEMFPPGDIELRLHADSLFDFGGNPLGTEDIVSTFTVLEATALWINDAGGDWDDPNNWDGGELPGPDDHVLIDVPANVEIRHGTGDTVVSSIFTRNDFRLFGGTLQVTGPITAENPFRVTGGTLIDAVLAAGPAVTQFELSGFTTLDNVTIEGTARIPTGSQVTLENGLRVDGTLDIRDGFFPVLTVASDQSLTGAGIVNLNGGFFRSSKVEVAADTTLTIADGLTIRARTGSSEFGKDGSIVNNGLVEVAGSAELHLQGDAVTNNGTFAAGGGRLTLDNLTNLASGALTSGRFEASNGGNIRLAGNVAGITTNAATIILDGTGSQITIDDDDNALTSLANNAAGATLQLDGDATLAVTTATFSNGGTLSIGSAAALHVTGDLEQEGGGLWNAGIGANGMVGAINVTGEATLGGTLNVVLNPEVDPRLQSVQLMTFGSRVGEFAQITGVPDGLTFEADYGDTELRLIFGDEFDNPAAIPFAVDFNDLMFGPGGSSRANGSARVRVTSNGQPRSAGGHIVIDATTGTPSTGEFSYQLDVAGQSDFELTFYHRSQKGVGTALPAAFKGTASGDGVSISDDWINWHRIVDLSSAATDYTRTTIDLDAAITTAGLSGDNLAIKFQQSTASTSDGGAFDDVRIAADSVGPTIDSITPTGPLVFAADLSELSVMFSETLNSSSANDAANWQLIGDGVDDIFGNEDDVSVPLTPNYDDDRTVTLAAASPLTNDTYRLTADGTNTITDAAGVPLNDGLDASFFFDVFAPEDPTNDTTGTATDTGITAAGGRVSLREAIGNNDQGASDIDVFEFVGETDQGVRIQVTGRPTPGSDVAQDLQLRLLDSSGSSIISAHVPNSGNASLFATLATDGTYFVEVTSPNSTAVVYDLDITTGDVIADFPVIDNFEAGPPLNFFWEVSSTEVGRIRVTDMHDPLEGSFHVVADTDTPVDPWLLVYETFDSNVQALDDLGLIRGVDYIVTLPQEFAMLSPTQIGEFDVVYVPSTFDFTGLRDGDQDDGVNDLSEALLGEGTPGRAVLTGLDIDAFTPDGQERELLGQALQWVREGDTVGLVASSDGTRWSWTPWADELVPATVLNTGQVVSVTPGDHPVKAGLTNAGLSDWNPSYFSFVNTDITGFETLAVDASDPNRRVLLAMDGPGSPLPPENREQALNEAIMRVDLAGQDNVELSFVLTTFGGSGQQIDPLPPTFIGSVDGTGVSISTDGTTWHSLFDQPLPGGLRSLPQSIDLDEFLAEHSLPLGPTAIKFQQFGFGPAPFAGLAIDDIRLVPDVVGPVIDHVAPIDFWPTTLPNAVATGDINGDGVDDIVTGGVGFSRIVTVMTSDGAGGMEPPVEIGGAGNIQDVKLFDVNDDGDLDLITAHPSAFPLQGGVSIFLGDGTGGFGAPVFIASGDGASTVDVGDVNGDGTPDIITAPTSTQPRLHFYSGDGTGAFAEPVPISVPSGASEAVLFEMNGDGRLDIITLGSPFSSNNIMSVLLQSAEGTFDVSEFSIPQGAMSLNVVTLPGDDDPDVLFVTSPFGEAGIAAVMHADGSGGFGLPTQLDVGPGPKTLTVADINGDTFPDVITGNHVFNMGTSVSIVPGDEFGTFGLGETLPLPPRDRFTQLGPIDVAVANVKGAGGLDVVVIENNSFSSSGSPANSFGNGGLTLLTDDGSGGFSRPEHLPAGGIRLPNGLFKFDHIDILFGETGTLDESTLMDPGNFSLIGAGPDGLFDAPAAPSGDDFIVRLSGPTIEGDDPNHESIVGFDIAAADFPLLPGVYRFTIDGTSSVRDAEGNPLNDHDGDGTGADHVVEFEILDHGPVVIDQYPRRSEERLPGIDQLILEFSQDIDPTTFTLDDEDMDGTVDDIPSFTGPDGDITPTGVLVGGRFAVIQFPPQTTLGNYEFEIGPDILDTTGRAMNHNFNATFGEENFDNYDGGFVVGLTLYDGDDFVYDFQNGVLGSGGQLENGVVSSRNFSQAEVLSVENRVYAPDGSSAVLEDATRTILFGEQTITDLVVQREAYVPESGGTFVRLVEVLHNPTAAPIDVSVFVGGFLNSGDATILAATSDGDSDLEATDNWFVTHGTSEEQFGGGAVALVIQDGAAGSLGANTLMLDNGQYSRTFDVSIAAGETIRLLSFLIQTENANAAETEAAALAALPGRALANLSAVELASIVNFSIGDPIRAVEVPTVPKPTSPLSAGALVTLADSAITTWLSVGLPNNLANKMRGVSIGVADLPGDMLASRFTTGILVDQNAAGQGWFVDRTPESDDDLPEDAIDLLSVIAHELGHELGLDDNLDPLAEDIMAARLAAGQRRTPTRADVDAIMAELAD